MGSAKDGEGAPRRSSAFADELVSKPEDCSTLYESLSRSVKKYGDAPCFGTRKKIREEKRTVEEGDEKREWTFYEFGPFEFQSYKDAYRTITAFASGLRHLGLNPSEKLAIYEETRYEWCIAEQACYTQNITVLTVYSNLGLEALEYALKTAEVTFIAANPSLLSQLVSIKEELLLKCIILIGTEDELRDTESANILRDSGIQIIFFQEVISLGESHTFTDTPPTPESLACIMYTSGSTGMPKGVMITHANMIAAVGGFGKQFAIQSDDAYLSYLPLAHVLALVVSNTCIHFGVSMGFSNPKTLTDDAMVENCPGDIRAFRPTIFAGVPMVYDRIKKGIKRKVEAEPRFKQYVFDAAVAVKRKAWKRNAHTNHLDAAVFGKFKESFGGRVRFMVSGGAPLSESAHLFLAACFGVPLLQGYGLTETCGAGCAMLDTDHSQGSVGPPVPCVEIKLVDVPDMGYSSKNKPETGEIWIRGPCVSQGYYKDKEKTDEVFTSDGWFKTGDVGQWNANGTLSIIDRIKNLVKGPGGEYIALEKLESVYKNSPYVANTCVYASKDVPKVVAIIDPQPETMKKENITHPSTDEAFAQRVLEDLRKVASKNNLKKHELPTDVILADNEWSPDNNMLTAAMKLNRRAIYDNHEKQLKKIVKPSTKKKQ